MWQAVALQAAGVLPKHFVLLDVKDDVAAERSIGKKVDPVTGDVYHVTYDMPSKPDIVSRLVDGNSEREMTKDLLEYHKNIDGVLRCYPHITKTINADQPKTDVLALVLTFLCTKHRSSAPHMPRIVLLGPPGSGKNTQAALLAKKYNIVNVSCSQAIKQAVSDGSKMGEALKPYIDRKMMSKSKNYFDCVSILWYSCMAQS
jgi:adenylate kinase